MNEDVFQHERAEVPQESRNHRSAQDRERGTGGALERQHSPCVFLLTLCQTITGVPPMMTAEPQLSPGNLIPSRHRRLVGTLTHET